MGTATLTHRAGAAVLLLLLIAVTGCDTGQSFSRRRLIEHQAMLDFSDLEAERAIPEVKVTMQPPEDWDALPLRRNALYAHQQWRSPSRATGVGVAHVRLPLPLGTRALLWLARQEYSKQSNDGRVLDEWTDAIGRQWFEAENNRYHVRGFVVLDGLNAWFIYNGYKTGTPLHAPELTLAAKCVETITPYTRRPRSGSIASAGD